MDDSWVQVSMYSAAQLWPFHRIFFLLSGQKYRDKKGPGFYSGAQLHLPGRVKD